MSSFKREADGCIGWEKNKTKQKKIESDNHLVAVFFFPPEDTRTGCRICNQTKASSSVLAKLSCNSDVEQKLVLL